MVADSGCLCGMNLRGGKLGLFAFGQSGVIWSNMKYRCLPGRTICNDVISTLKDDRHIHFISTIINLLKEINEFIEI